MIFKNPPVKVEVCDNRPIDGFFIRYSFCFKAGLLACCIQKQINSARA